MSLAGLLAHNPPITLAFGWITMLVAMMGPLLAAPLHHVRARSFAARRPRAITLFLTGYAAVWIIAGAVLLPLALSVRPLVAESSLSAAVITGLAILWQCSPARQRCLNAGHRHPPLRATGVAANLDVLRFGSTHGLWCVGACWVLMTLPLLLPGGHAVAMTAMGGISLWLAGERMESPAPLEWRLRVPLKAVRLLLAHARMFVIHPSAGGRFRLS
jgi:predicted metal-binding membrane protein